MDKSDIPELIGLLAVISYTVMYVTGFVVSINFVVNAIRFALFLACQQHGYGDACLQIAS